MRKYSKPNLNTFALSCCIAAPTQQRKSIQVEFWILHIYSPDCGDFCRTKKNSTIVSLMCCQRSGLQKTLKYSQSRDLEGIQWILWIYTDAAPAIKLTDCNWQAEITGTRIRIKVIYWSYLMFLVLKWCFIYDVDLEIFPAFSGMGACPTVVAEN